MISKEKRKKIEKLALETYKIVDPTNINYNELKRQFDSMSDAEFDKWAKGFFADDDAMLYLCSIPYVNELKVENIEKALNYIGVPMFETVAMPYLNPGGEVYVTQEKVATGYLHIKRPQQMASKKNSMSIHSEQRSPTNGQVTGADKNGRVSDMENIALVTLESDGLLKEFLSARSDDMKAKNEVLKQIQTLGYVDLSKIETKPSDKVALNTMDVYFTSCGIKTDLITDGLLLQKTLINQNSIKQSTSSKYNTSIK